MRSMAISVLVKIKTSPNQTLVRDRYAAPQLNVAREGAGGYFP